MDVGTDICKGTLCMDVSTDLCLSTDACSSQKLILVDILVIIIRILADILVMIILILVDRLVTHCDAHLPSHISYDAISARLIC